MNKNIILVPIISIFFLACSSKNTPHKLEDLKKYSQNPKHYTKNIQTLENQKEKDEEFNKNYFNVWSIDKLSFSKEDAKWGEYYQNKKTYFDNLKPIKKSWFKRQIDNSNFEEYNKHLKKAIITNNSNLRVFPSNSKIFYNPSKAGEGFPFDYNQVSSIKINTPIIISHYSKDRSWAFVESHISIGWVRLDDLALLDEKFIKRFKNNNYYIASQDKFPVFSKTFIDFIKLGTIFPKEKDKFLIVSRDFEGNAKIKKIEIYSELIDKKPLEFNQKNINKISSQLIGEPYGWGGLLGHRDCSSFTKDFFASFGIFLKRNSKAQISNGNYISISHLNNQEKKEYITKNAIPFLTLVYLRGHIMLYIGEQNSTPLVMHNIWGVKTENFFGETGRFIVGKNVISTLELGKDLKDYKENNSLLSRIEGLVFLD